MTAILCLGCGTKTKRHRGGRCRQCQSVSEAKRVAQREGRYDARHRALRREWLALVRQGVVLCCRCHERISTREQWHLDHHPGGLHPAHVRCNARHTGRTKYGG